MTIRPLGALLSTYQRLSGLPDDPRGQAEALGLPGKLDVKKYAPRMLELAKDLGERLLPAFKTSTGLPYARVNLRKGLEARESVETCSAGAGSLVLEFTLLSRLTGDPRFEVRKGCNFADDRIWGGRRSWRSGIGGHRMTLLETASTLCTDSGLELDLVE